ncbi:cobalamin biosynthesis protein [Bradyrhizobium sp. S69]|uniref:cobalamin biosynthesis protein n=1 Tax=Bradyrhizobium sp. S69 TaxID=1641856 RepID=UPI001FEE43F6|nr:cobalamin biosynthesis protein [Bradyrhizobium sp. S69]
MSRQKNRMVIGLGFRDQASAQSVGEVLADVVAKAARPDATVELAVVEDKATHPSLLIAAHAAHLSIKPVAAETLRAADARVTTRSERVLRQRGVGSVCEAAALAIAGSDARLVVTRQVSTDRNATAAVALSEDIVP